jgi:hypothetical protein
MPHDQNVRWNTIFGIFNLNLATELDGIDKPQFSVIYIYKKKRKKEKYRERVAPPCLITYKMANF